MVRTKHNSISSHQFRTSEGDCRSAKKRNLICGCKVGLRSEPAGMGASMGLGQCPSRDDASKHIGCAHRVGPGLPFAPALSKLAELRNWMLGSDRGPSSVRLGSGLRYVGVGHAWPETNQRKRLRARDREIVWSTAPSPTRLGPQDVDRRSATRHRRRRSPRFWIGGSGADTSRPSSSKPTTTSRRSRPTPVICYSVGATGTGSCTSIGRRGRGSSATWIGSLDLFAGISGTTTRLRSVWRAVTRVGQRSASGRSNPLRSAARQGARIFRE